MTDPHIHTVKGDERMSVGSNIKKLRLEKEMTQEELATATNVSRVMIAQIERDSRCPTVILGKTIAEALGCSIEKLLEAEGE